MEDVRGEEVITEAFSSFAGGFEFFASDEETGLVVDEGRIWRGLFGGHVEWFTNVY